MACDEALAGRMRAALAGVPGLSERRMMGAICVFLDGHMVAACHRDRATGAGWFMVRLGRDGAAAARGRDGAEPVVLGGRTMAGFLRLPEAACTEARLADWLARALAHVRTLPPKPQGPNDGTG